ncbi:hypothetical protein BX600DRAFT_512101 [Xylariales sp. PMI_506]|nr:hypothetical protein BX600DRAFT_512101 [Xylariales sp. PMI_506]
MMHSLVGMGMIDHVPQFYPTVPFLDEITKQQAFSESSRRMSRSSTGYRPANAMRVVKPSSASNSPQAMMQRRRTLMNDGNLARRRQYALDQTLHQQQHEEQQQQQQQQQNMQGISPPCEVFEEPVKRASRPVSWHPGSHPQQQLHLQQLPQFDYSQYAIPISAPYADADVYSGYQPFPPTPAVYSGQTSPMSTFSPLSQPQAAPSQAQISPQYLPADNWVISSYADSHHHTAGSDGTLEPFPSYTGPSAFNWDGYPGYGTTCTAPPTPDSHEPVSPSVPTIAQEDTITYEALNEPEDEGEVLIGMGLYDAPSKDDDGSEFTGFKTTASILFGTTNRKGAGLKLEEAWEPPKEDDEEEEEEGDVDDDADQEDDE